MKLLRSISLLLLTVLLGACSTQKNTPTTRWWKAFKSRYNTYYNGHQAYLEGMQAKVEGNKDDYTSTLPLLMVTNKNSQKLGQSNFETTITKCEKTIKLYSIKKKPQFKRGHRLTPEEKAFRNRKEFNPFLKNAWILMGKAQLEKGDYIEAASTFAYTERLYRDQPQIANVARSLLALCYTQLDWFYDAEDLLRKIKRDSIPRAARHDYNTALTNYYLRQKKWEEALPYLRKEMSHLPGGIPKARGYFLLGQVCHSLNLKKDAYKALQSCLHQSPPYELRFNAEILQTEVMPQGDNKKKLSKLNRMARQVNNKDYLDQVYYAIGNVFMAMPDTTRAIQAYVTGNAKATRSGMPKAILNLSLGDLYWARQRFGYAQKCYNTALGILDKEHERYNEIDEKTKVLDKLVPYTSVIEMEDSLQALVRMPEKERLAAIDKLIEMEKKRQKEAKQQRADSLARTRGGGTGGNINAAQNTQAPATTGAGGGTTWYFYNQQTVISGAEQFKKIWGNRRNEDNWRRSNKSVLSIANNEDLSEEAQDSIDAAEAALNDSLAAGKKKKGEEKADSAQNDPLKREYYLAQLPFTEEQMQASNEKLKPALYNAGVIEKDELENYPLAKSTLLRLYTQFPDYQPMDELLYQLFLLELHWGQPGEADLYKNRLAADFPESKYTILITAPDYVENARYGKHLEDSLYANTYDAYRNSDYATMDRNCKISAEKYPKGDNRAKFMFLDAMSRLRQNDVDSFVSEMRNVATNYTDDKISELAGTIVKSIDAGRIPGTGQYDLNSLWMSRSSAAQDEADASLKEDTLNAERMTDFVVILPYSKDSVDEGKLLYEVSRFNFTNFNIRNFEIEIIESGALSQMNIKGFYTFDEAHRYEQEIFKDSACRSVLTTIKPILISEHNLKLVGVKYTMGDYDKFYQKHFVPSKVKEELKLDTEPENFIWDEFQEVDDKDKENKETEEQEIEEDGGEWY